MTGRRGTARWWLLDRWRCPRCRRLVLAPWHWALRLPDLRGPYVHLRCALAAERDRATGR